MTFNKLHVCEIFSLSVGSFAICLRSVCCITRDGFYGMYPYLSEQMVSDGHHWLTLRNESNATKIFYITISRTLSWELAITYRWFSARQDCPWLTHPRYCSLALSHRYSWPSSMLWYTIYHINNARIFVLFLLWLWCISVYSVLLASMPSRSVWSYWYSVIQ